LNCLFSQWICTSNVFLVTLSILIASIGLVDLIMPPDNLARPVDDSINVGYFAPAGRSRSPVL
jgi:hypothetical protein